MKIEEIQTALGELVAAMVEKGAIRPSAEFKIKSGANFYVYLWCAHETRQFDGEYMKVFSDDTPAEAIDNACAYIAALPSPEEAVTREYLTRVASAIDYATENSIADEYVTPLRGVTCAMTENLLTEENSNE